MAGIGDISALVWFEVYMEISDRVCNNKESDLQPCFLSPCECVCVCVCVCERWRTHTHTHARAKLPVNHGYSSYFLLDISDTVIKSNLGEKINEMKKYDYNKLIMIMWQKKYM